MNFYCMRCKKKVEVKEYKEKKTSKGVRMAMGNCPNCNTKVAKILGK